MRATDELLLGLPESTYGEVPDPAPAGSNVIWVRDVEDTPIEADEEEETNLNPEFGSRAIQTFAHRKAINFTIPLCGHATPGTALPEGFLIRACGFSEDVTPATSVAYQPASLSTDSASLWRYKGGNLSQLLGARGSFALSLTNRKILERKLTMKGLYGPVAASSIPAGDFSNWQKPMPLVPATNSSFSIHGFSGALEAMEIEVNNKYEYEGRIGNEAIDIDGREMKGQITIEAVNETAKPFIEICRSDALAPVVLDVAGVGVGQQRHLQISMPLVQLMNPKYVSIGNNKQGLQMDMIIKPTAAGDDEYVETWTAVA